MQRARLLLFTTAFTVSLLMAASATGPGAALAQDRPRSQRVRGSVAAPTLASLGEIVPKLESANQDEVREAIDLLSVIDRPEVVAPLAAMLRAGQSDAVTDRAIEALGGLAHPSAIDVLAEFTHHRRPGARRRAYKALAGIHDLRVQALVAEGLRDSDRSVRGTVALALGDMGAVQTLDVLFLAFERGVVEAAISIGKLGDAHAVERYSEHLGRQPLAVMLTGYDQFLRRSELPEQVKTNIVARLGEVAGPMVKRFLQDYQRTFSARDRSALRRAVEETVRRIPDEPSVAPAAPADAPAGGGGQ